jgi:hypothetical protein
VILGFPWLARVNPQISFSEATWRHPIERRKLEVLSAKEFIRAMESEPYIFLLVAAPTQKPRRVAAVLTKGGVLIPEKYHDRVRVFSTEAAGILPDHHAMEHRIDLEPGSQPPYGPVYALLEKELEVLREYLDAS